MNREIKFRAWDKKRKNMSRVGSVEFIDKSPEQRPGVNVFTDEDKIRNDHWIDAENAVLMQYTGLKDKNGKEIYEGDVLELWGISIVVWNEDACCFQYAYHAIGRGTSTGGRMTNTLYKHKEKDYEIIGNIYENPELIQR